MPHYHRLGAVLAAAVLAAGCSDALAPEDMVVELTLSSAHVHILSELTFTVTVTDLNGTPLTDFDTLRVERRAHGDETWRGTDLVLSGTAYSGTYTFASSGEYDIRVTGRRGGDDAMVELHRMAEHLAVARAHAEAGGYRVEFESFPGHLHENDTGVLRYWVMEPERNANNVRPPITGLVATIECEDGTGTEMHNGVGMGDGTYEASHTFTEAGDFHTKLLFTGTDGLPAEVEFHLHVAHGH